MGNEGQPTGPSTVLSQVPTGLAILSAVPRLAATVLVAAIVSTVLRLAATCLSCCNLFSYTAICGDLSELLLDSVASAKWCHPDTESLRHSKFVHFLRRVLLQFLHHTNHPPQEE